MSKGIFGLGCSFMFGESLYFYSDLTELPFGKLHNYNPDNITDGMVEYKNKYRFIQLVSDYYNTWCSVKSINGQNNTRNAELLNLLYENTFVNDPKFYFKLHINDYKLIIFQFTSIYRDDMNINELLLNVNKYFTYFEKIGIKVVTLTWMNEIFNNTIYQENYLNRHVNINIDGIEKSSFEEFIHNDSFNITVRSDFMDRGLQLNDLHLNHKGNELFAKSIIKKLEQDNFKI